MNILDLKSLVKQVIEEESSKKTEIDSLIAEYMESKNELDEFVKEFAHVLKKHKSLTDAEKKKLSQVEKMMIRFSVVKRVVDNMVFEIQSVPKYKVVRNDFKELFEQAFNKLNWATKRIIAMAAKLQKDEKKAAYKDQLHVSRLKEYLDDSIVDELNNIIKGMKVFTSAAADIQKVVKHD